MLTGEAADWPWSKKLAALWQVDVAATIELSRLVGARMVASNVPVHVELAIEDPGEAAVNYYLNFR